MKVKYIDGEDWNWLDTYSCEITRSEESYRGTISLIYDATVKYKLIVDYEPSSKVLFDDGYRCVTFIPDEGFWSVNAVYDAGNQIVEWYFDVLFSKDFNDEGRLYYLDLYLDVVIRPDFETVLIDEDDLQEALETGVIDQKQFDFAYQIADELMSKVAKNREFLVTFLEGYLELDKHL